MSMILFDKMIKQRLKSLNLVPYLSSDLSSVSSKVHILPAYQMKTILTVLRGPAHRLHLPLSLYNPLLQHVLRRPLAHLCVCLCALLLLGGPLHFVRQVHGTASGRESEWGTLTSWIKIVSVVKKLLNITALCVIPQASVRHDAKHVTKNINPISPYSP